MSDRTTKWKMALVNVVCIPVLILCLPFIVVYSVLRLPFWAIESACAGKPVDFWVNGSETSW